MRCPACGQANPKEAGFCMRCGAALRLACPRCETALPPEATFCFRCGVPVAVAPGDPNSDAAGLPDAFAGGRYLVRRPLGEGGKKQVYLVHDTLLDREVAFSLLKTEELDAAGVERVRREARTMGRLGGHPHIVSIHDMGEEAGRPYLVSEFMAGGDLESLIARAPDRRAPLDQVVRIADQVLQALEYAHADGVIHRDLKPGNIWLTRDGVAKLGDFGLAAAIDRTRRSVSGMIVGTVEYMAPEQALGRPPDTRSDLYSFGALLYELVTGRPPFLGDDPVAIIGQHINAAPVAPSWHNPYLPKPLEALVLQLLAKDPAERPQSASAVRRELASVSVLAGSPYRVATGAGEANPLDRLAGGVFVGREQELALLRSAFDAAAAGRSGVALLAGEPGIGKTTLAEETATYARLRGAQVFWGRCYEWEGAPAYWPWVQILRGYIEGRDAERLQADLGPGAATIAQIVPELREALPDLPEPPRMEGEQARFRLFDSVAGFLRHATAQQPLLLVLDDLHWADTPSLLLLQFVARELGRAGLLIVGTYRDVEIGRRHPLSTTLAELSRDHGTQRLVLHGLTSDDIARMIALSTGSQPDPELVEAVQRETEGNPFFVSEVVRLLVAEGRLARARRPASWSVSIPESVRDVIGRRLDRLSETCNEVLAVASVVGREFSLPVLERVSGQATETLLDGLEEAVRARLVQEVEVARRYRFTHALVQDTLYAGLSASRRLHLHAATGAALEHAQAANLAPFYGEIAYHFAIAAPAGHAVEAFDYAVWAGDRAMDQFAWEAAIQHYERALHALDLQPAPDPAQRCDLLLALGTARFRSVLDADESPEGPATFLEAAEIARSLGSFERMARAVIGFAGINVARTPFGVQQVRLLEETLALAPPGDIAIKARLMARLAADYRVLPGTAERTDTLSREALDMARRIGDAATLAPVLLSRYLAIWGPDTLDERLLLAPEALRYAEEAGDAYHAAWSHLFSTYGLYEIGDSAGLDRAIAGMDEAARQSGIPYVRWITSIWEVGRLIRQGDFARVEEAAVSLGGDSQVLVAVYARTILLFLLRREQGRLQELDAPLQAIIDMAEDRPAPLDRHRGHIAQMLRLLLLVETGREAEARARYAVLAGSALGDLPKDSYWLGTLCILAEVCALLADRDHATALYERLLAYDERNVAPASTSGSFGPVAYYLALLATALGRRDAATQHFETALGMNTVMQARPANVWAKVGYADLLIARARPGDWDRARALLEQALADAREIGMPRRAVQAEGLLAMLGTLARPSRRVDAHPYGLSARELEVLQLVVAGKSDQEIADTLFISKRTVNTHISNILAKLNVGSRVEAAALAVRGALA